MSARPFRNQPLGHQLPCNQPPCGQQGAALLVAVMITAVLSVVVGAVGLFALADVRIAAASRDQVQARAAVDAAREIAIAALAAEVDLAAVRGGRATAAASGTPRLVTTDGAIDVDALTRSLAQTRRRLPPPWGSDEWRPYLWGRLSELVAAGGAGRDEPLVVVWVRGDVAAGGDPERLELAITAVTPGRARASEIALVDRRPGGLALNAVWPELEVLSVP